MSPSTPSITSILPPELLHEICAHATVDNDFSTLRTLALVSHQVNSCTYDRLRRHISLRFLELYLFMDIERPSLESLEISYPKTSEENPLQGNKFHIRNLLRPLEVDNLLMARFWPNISRLSVRDKARHVVSTNNFIFTEGLACLPNLTTLYLDYDRCLIRQIQSPWKFAALTHLCLPAPLWESQETPARVSPDCFPVLTHVALLTNYKNQNDLHHRLSPNFHKAARDSAAWLAIPSLCRLMFRWDASRWHPATFSRELQNYIAENDFDDRVVCISLDDYDSGSSSEENSCFDFMDRMWKLGEEAHQQQKEMRRIKDW